VSLRISSITEIDSSKVTLKLSLSDPLVSMKKEATSSTRKKHTGRIMLVKYNRGLLLIVICHEEKTHQIAPIKKKKMTFLLQ